MAIPIGFIGLGIMGKPMAINLLNEGIQLMVYDINNKAINHLCEKGAIRGLPKEIAEKCEIIFLILPNGTIVEEVLFGKNGLAEQLCKGVLVCDLSSVSPKEAISFGDRLEKMGIEFLDSPVSGGEPKAIDGTLSFMAGGKQKNFEKLLPYFNIMGSSATLTGGRGSGCVTKLVNQIIVNLNIAVLSEGMVLAAKAGADPEKVYQAIRGGAAGSTMLDAKVPMIIDRNFKPGGKISINIKDIKNVVETAHEIDMPIPLTSQLYEIMKSLKIAGQMEEDHSSIVKYFERLAGVEVKKLEL